MYRIGGIAFVLVCLLVAGCEQGGPRISRGATPVLPISQFPRPYQGPTEISGDAWTIEKIQTPDLQDVINKLGKPPTSRTSKPLPPPRVRLIPLRWRDVEQQIRDSLQAVGLSSSVWAFGGNTDTDTTGFVVISDVQHIDKDGHATDRTTDISRQFVFVLMPDVLQVTDRPMSSEELTYYYAHGASQLSDELATTRRIDPTEDGDHLFVLTYRFERKPFTPSYRPVDEKSSIDHYQVSGLREQMRKFAAYEQK